MSAGRPGGILRCCSPAGRGLRNVSRMRRVLIALLWLAPLAAAAQEFALRSPSIGDALRTMDLMSSRPKRPLEQTLVIPERPGQNQVAWYGFDWQFVDVPPPGGGAGGIRLYYYRNENAQARRALPAIQSAYARLVDQFHYSPTKRIPYILYATQREFQTQNVFQVTEGVLGVTSPAGPQDDGAVLRRPRAVRRGLHARDGAPVHHPEAGQDLPAPTATRPPSTSCRSGSSRGSPSTTRRAGSTSRPTCSCATWCGTRIRKAVRGGAFAEDRYRGYIPTYKLGQARVAFIADQYGPEDIQAFIERVSPERGGRRRRRAGARLRGARPPRAQRADRAGGCALARLAQAPVLRGVPGSAPGPAASATSRAPGGAGGLRRLARRRRGVVPGHRPGARPRPPEPRRPALPAAPSRWPPTSARDGVLPPGRLRRDGHRASTCWHSRPRTASAIGSTSARTTTPPPGRARPPGSRWATAARSTSVRRRATAS